MRVFPSEKFLMMRERSSKFVNVDGICFLFVNSMHLCVLCKHYLRSRAELVALTLCLLRQRYYTLSAYFWAKCAVDAVASWVSSSWGAILLISKWLAPSYRSCFVNNMILFVLSKFYLQTAPTIFILIVYWCVGLQAAPANFFLVLVLFTM